MGQRRVLGFAVVALLFALASCGVQAQRSLECQKVWTGPSMNNDLVDCLKDSSRIGSQWKYYIFPGFAALVFLVALLALPIIMICRCCNCCASCMQSFKSVDRAKSRCWLFMCIVIAILWACGVCVLIIGGANIITQSANRILDNVQSGPLDYFTQTKDTVLRLIVDQTGTVPKPDIDVSKFDDLISTVNKDINTTRDDYFKYFKIAQIVADCVGAVGVLLMLFILLFACCRCNGCCSAAFSALYVVFALIFALLAIVFTVTMYGTAAACGEVTLQYKRVPGVLQWYAVPYCEKEFDFEKVHTQVDDQVTVASHTACTKLLEYCDNVDTYDFAANPNKIFRCGEGIVAATDCPTLEKVSSVLKSTYVKPILSNMLCTNTTGWEYMEKCTLEECSERCTNLDTPNIQAKTWSTQVMGESDYALNVSEALSYLRPLLGCNYIIDKIATAIEKENLALDGVAALGKSTECSTMHTSSVMLGVGFFVGSLMFIMGFYVLQRGSWIWSLTDKEKQDKDRDEDK